MIEASLAVAPTKERARSTTRIRDRWIYLLLALLVGAAWQISRLHLFDSRDAVGYWLGVAGGSAVLLLFTYPLRKHVRALHRLGNVRFWLIAHMLLGVAGPLLILLHSGFRVGAPNSGVALYSMLIVAASGVIGRFLYLHVYRGLTGVRTNLQALRARTGLDGTAVRSWLRFAPEVEARLKAFEASELERADRAHELLDRILLLPLRRLRTERACNAELRARFRTLAQDNGWNPDDRRRRLRSANALVRRFLRGVTQAAQFGAYERLFALWHVAHVPFVYLLVLSAAFHVFAVHAY